VVFALGQIGHRSAREALEGRLADPDPETVGLAIEALGKLGDTAATRKVSAFLRNGSPALRAEAAMAMWRLADSTGIDALLSAHNDADAGVRWRVLYALERVVDPDRVVLIAALHLGDAEWLSRAYAARTIGRQRSPRGGAYLLQALRDPEVAVVVNAARALQLIADSTSHGSAVELAARLDHPHPYVRVTVATALADHAFWPPLSAEDRAAVLDSLRAHLRDPDAATRGACARALIARDALGPAALDSMRSDSSAYARAAVIQAFTLMPAERAEPLALAGFASGRMPLERIAAAEVLGTLDTPATVRALRDALADTSVLIVAAAAYGLADAGDSASVPALAVAYRSRARDADPDARQSIRDALRQLAGRPFADSVERANPATAPARPYADDFATAPAARGAVLKTSAGEIEWAFYREEAPQTVRNFVRLARTGYFDGLSVHRVVPHFVIQDGDPTGTGSGGPGYSIRCEYNRLRYEPGRVGMALSGKDTGGSQWFITHSPQPHLDGRYTIFAHVVRGMDVVHRIVQGDRVLKVEILE
jgi:cyclophilin family peptidyl-prolyl cis-trans isomerase/HEAT repeat protein